MERHLRNGVRTELPQFEKILLVYRLVRVPWPTTQVRLKLLSTHSKLSAYFSLDTDVSPPDKWRSTESRRSTHLVASKGASRDHQHGTSG